MSKYTTGEIAKLCGVTVRTVQYYDTQSLLHPSDLSEGGRRLYSEGDLERMRLICTLRSLGLSLDTIKKIFQEGNSGNVLRTFLAEQGRLLDEEIRQRQEQRETIAQLCRGLEASRDFSVENLPDIAHRMANRKKLHKLYAWMLTVGVVMDCIEIGTILLWIFTGVWWPFAVGMPLVIVCCVLLVRMYHRNTRYICPDCHMQFKPGMREFFFSGHTLKTRKLTCPGCGHKSYCVETYGKEG